jgi:hypothetical protein
MITSCKTIDLTVKILKKVNKPVFPDKPKQKKQDISTMPIFPVSFITGHY